MTTEIKPEGGGIIPLKKYTLKELCALYRVDRDTFFEWLQPFQAEIGKRVGNFYQIPQVRVIFKKLDLPDPPEDENSKMAA